MKQENDYRMSFFRPTTERAMHNRNMVLWLISTWAIAIFGFQFLLWAIEKPTPEPELITFNQVWPAIQSDEASNEEILKFTNSALHVAGKVFIAPEHKVALDNGITWGLFQLANPEQKMALEEALAAFEGETEKAVLVTDESYIQSKLKLGALSQAILGLPSNSALAKILPLELHSSGINDFTTENKAIVTTCMPHYTIHNRSVLTDTIFLGFPFHYFYTAVLLLLLFIGICYGYCRQVDRFNKKIGIIE